MSKRKSPIELLKELRALVEKRGGKCLAEEYVNNTTKLKFICSEGHIWKASPSKIKYGRWCPKCANKKSSIDRRGSIEEIVKIAQSRGGECLSKEYINNNTKLRFKCKDGHIWETTPSKIKRGQWCPYCSGHKASKGNSLAVIDKKLAREWHPTKNNNLTPKDIKPGSHKKVWWLCDKNHEWQAVIKNRHKGSGCPYCSGYKASIENNIAQTHPHLVKEWHPTKNGLLTPKDVSKGSEKKIWWICSKGHEWIATPYTRKTGSNCPFCANKAVGDDNNLQVLNPILASEWHPTKNGNLNPCNVTQKSGKTVWWLCDQGHEWQARIASRTRTNCPFCSGARVTEETCLAAVNPELAKEWHPIRNGELTPQNIKAGSGKRVWWKCKNNHEWESVIYHRQKGAGCPMCSKYGTSEYELRLLSELRLMFDNVKHREIVHGVECDLFLPDLKLGIEIDGGYWHTKKVEKDIEKSEHLKNKGILLIRFRGIGLKKISKNDILFTEKNGLQLKDSKKLIKFVITEFKDVLDNVDVLSSYLKSNHFINEKGFIELRNLLPSPEFEKSLESISSTIAKQWHPTKNGKLEPKDVTPLSNKKIWWLCNEGHEWETRIGHRYRGSNCPYCSGLKKKTIEDMRKVASERGGECLSETYINNGKKLKWKCKDRHIWMATPNLIMGSENRKGCWCPECANLKKGNYNRGNLKEYQEIAKNWGGICLSTSYVNSTVKLKWLCKEGHIWEASPGKIKGSENRKGTWCPECADQNKGSSQKLSIEQMKGIAQRKGGECISKEYINSRTELIWECEKGHRWKKTPERIKGFKNRKGTWCPICASEKTSK
jgi:hypothetical protein